MSLEQKLYEELRSKFADEEDSVKVMLFDLVWSNKTLRARFLENIDFEISTISVKVETRGRKPKKAQAKKAAPKTPSEPEVEPEAAPKKSKPKQTRKSQAKKAGEELSDEELARRIAESLGGSADDDDSMIPEVYGDDSDEEEGAGAQKKNRELEKEVLFG